jgi:CRISPR-associated protein Cas1
MSHTNPQNPVPHPRPEHPAEPIPARMLNEVIYCERLCFIEWVQGIFVHNSDTAAGRFAHRNVDNLPSHRRRHDRSAGDPPWQSRSVELSSDRLGVISKLDVVELTGPETAEGHSPQQPAGEPPASAVPVEYKKGSPAPTDTGLYDPELVQLTAQMELLADNGYSVPHGEVYFAETRTRVQIEPSEEHRALLDRAIDRAHAVRQMQTPPGPLVDSPKCPRCSLAGVCLPDEVNLLTQRTSDAPRVLVPGSDRRQPLYVTSPGASLGKTADRIVVRKDGEVIGERRILDTSHVCLFGVQQVSSRLHHALFDADIPVLWLSSGAWLKGVGLPVSGKNVPLRVRQTAVAVTSPVEIGREFVFAKIRNSRTQLMRNSRTRDASTEKELLRLSERAATAASVESLLGTEGAAARLYFQRFATMFTESSALAFDFAGRNRRPPQDPVNAMLSFAYALLTKEAVTACVAVGLDPYLGILHRPRSNRPSAALDLMEEFRPIVADSVVLQVINNGEVQLSSFVEAMGAVALTQKGRQTMIAAFERRMQHEIRHPAFGYKVSYRRLIELQARMLAAHLLGELDRYVGFRTR